MNLLDSFFDAAAPEAKLKTSLLEDLGYSQRAVPTFTETPGRNSVRGSRDFNRVLELARRPRPTDVQLALWQAKWERALGKGNVPCECEARFRRRCVKHLKPIQAWVLEEMSTGSGIVGPISVGGGKTLLDLLSAMALPNCRVAVLLIPPSLKQQLLQVDWEFYAQHWNLPNLSSSRWIEPNKPMLHVVAYSELSSARNSDRLEQIGPDLVIADEVHLLRNATAARSKRFKRYFTAHPQARLVGWSGTLTNKSLKDYAMISNIALKEGSPTPINWPTVEEWAGALDPSDFPTQPGVLLRFCEPGEYVRDGYRRRFVESFGVVSSPPTGDCEASLVIQERRVVVPQEVHVALHQLYNTWQRPDGEELVSALDVHRCAKEISSGFYYRWRWPRNEPLEVRTRWLAVRKEWHREVREKLKQSKEFLDSPLLLVRAAIRWHDGFVHIQRDNHGHEVKRIEVPPFTKHGPEVTWASEIWPEWKSVRDTAQPETEGVWIHQFLAEDAAAWARECVGIVWYEHDLFGRRVAELADRRHFGPGAEHSERLLRETGESSIVASIRAHGTGKNLQSFCRNLIANSPSDSSTWEQLLGRTHRSGQLADEVTAEVYRHTAPVAEAFDKARGLANYVRGTLGGSQKLLDATVVLAPAGNVDQKTLHRK